jgi:hypothetical protein
MQPQMVFSISVLPGVVAWGLIGARDIWPALRTNFFGVVRYYRGPDGQRLRESSGIA